jgi:hypothetical protein
MYILIILSLRKFKGPQDFSFFLAVLSLHTCHYLYFLFRFRKVLIVHLQILRTLNLSHIRNLKIRIRHVRISSLINDTSCIIRRHVYYARL